MSRFGIAIAAAAVMLLGANAWAGEPTKEQVDELHSAQKKLAFSWREARGAGRLLAGQEKRRVDSLIERLEAGEAVDSAEIDRAIKRAEHGF
jgi:hypothetical protein